MVSESTFHRSLAGRCVFISGGGGAFVGRGMGRTIALAFGAAGARVVVADIDQQAAERTAELVSTSGGTSIAVVGDVASSLDVDRMVSEAEAQFGSVQVLVNHAGLGSYELAGDSNDETWRRIISVSLDGAFFLTRRVLPAMVASGSGVILNTNSVCGLAGGRAGAAYTAAKHGLVGLTKNVAATYGPRGIRCNGVAPGRVRDPLLAGDESVPAAPVGQTAEIDGTLSSMGMTMVGDATPQQVAELVIFLASDSASFINGVVVPIDGGWLAR